MFKKHYGENLKKQIVNIYNQGNHTYRSLSEELGIMKTKAELNNLGYQVSTRRIARIMKENALVSNYRVANIKFITRDVINQIFLIL